MINRQSRPLRFGVQLQAQRTSWNAYLQAVQQVEQLGFDALWNFDHLLPFAGADDEPCFQTITTLTAMALKTTRVRIGTLVNGVLYRDPATLAKAAVDIDHLSGGRLEFTLGASWAEREFTAYGLPFPPIAERMCRLDEALQIIRSLWTEERTTFEGQFYHLFNAPCEPKPVQQPHPPITIGGGGRKTLTLAAKYANCWNGIGSPEYMKARIEVLRGECQTVGRDFAELELSVHPKLAVAATHEEAEAFAHDFCARLRQDLESQRGEWLLGTPAEVREQLQAYVDAGITQWMIAVGAPFDMDMLALFAREVLPAFRTARS
jgi:F420-dependent oxidoreductase-like protein